MRNKRSSVRRWPTNDCWFPDVRNGRYAIPPEKVRKIPIIVGSPCSNPFAADDHRIAADGQRFKHPTNGLIGRSVFQLHEGVKLPKLRNRSNSWVNFTYINQLNAKMKESPCQVATRCCALHHVWQPNLAIFVLTNICLNPIYAKVGSTTGLRGLVHSTGEC